MSDHEMSSTFQDEENTLESPWTVWLDKKVRQVTRQESDKYAGTLKKLGGFKTVEGFYRLFSHMRRASELPNGVNVSLFRDGCKPMWEQFPQGGCWLVRVKRFPSSKDRLGMNPDDPNVVDLMWEGVRIFCFESIFNFSFLCFNFLNFFKLRNVKNGIIMFEFPKRKMKTGRACSDWRSVWLTGRGRCRSWSSCSRCGFLGLEPAIKFTICTISVLSFYEYECQRREIFFVYIFNCEFVYNRPWAKNSRSCCVSPSIRFPFCRTRNIALVFGIIPPARTPRTTFCQISSTQILPRLFRTSFSLNL